MAITKLSLYKDAIMAIGGRRISSLSEERKSRRVLDDVWDDGRVINTCLEAGPWAFATRTAKLEYDPDIDPDFGYQYGFAKPSDYVQTVAIASDEYFAAPLTQFADEAGYWFSDTDEIYVKYTSNDSSYGLDYTKWPQSFKEFVVLTLADGAVYTLTHSETRESVIRQRKERARISALGKDGIKKPTTFAPMGNFQLSRLNNGFRYDRAGRT